MSEYLETDEVVTNDHVPAESSLASAGLREEIALFRIEMAEGFRRHRVCLIASIAASTAVLGTLTSIL